MRRLIAVLVLCGCAGACVRKGKVPRLSGAAWLRLFAQYDRAVSNAPIDGLANRGVAGVEARGLLGSRLALCAGFDASFGGSEGAFVYDANLYLLGAGLRLGKTAQLAVCAGGGLSGAAGALPFAWQLPIEASVAFDLGGRVRPMIWARAARTFAAASRRDPNATLGFADEWAANVGVRIGTHRRWGRIHTGKGVLLGVGYTRLREASYLGVSIAHSITAGN